MRDRVDPDLAPAGCVLVVYDACGRELYVTRLRDGADIDGLADADSWAVARIMADQRLHRVVLIAYDGDTGEAMGPPVTVDVP